MPQGDDIMRKLRNNAGETIAETLVALLISALALVMLAGAISSAANMITMSDKKMGEYYDQDAKLASQNSADGNVDVTISASSIDGETGNVVSSETETREVDYYANTVFSSKPVVAYKISP